MKADIPTNSYHNTCLSYVVKEEPHSDDDLPDFEDEDDVKPDVKSEPDSVDDAELETTVKSSCVS